MLKCWFLRAWDHIAILNMLLRHLRQKWRLEVAGVTSVLLMMVLGVLLPAIASMLYGLHGNFADIAFIYASIASLGIAILIYKNSNLTLSRIFYEIRYSIRLFVFMLSCYKNIVREYRLYALSNHTSSTNFMDMTVVSAIFFRIFGLYFYNMDKKMKNSEPHLIDVEEMKAMFSFKTFNYSDFYSEVFFKPVMKDRETPYEQVVVDIFDTVLTNLYQKTWFTEYYSSDHLFSMIRHVLDSWYGKMVYHETIQNGSYYAKN